MFTLYHLHSSPPATHANWPPLLNSLRAHTSRPQIRCQNGRSASRSRDTASQRIPTQPRTIQTCYCTRILTHHTRLHYKNNAFVASGVRAGDTRSSPLSIIHHLIQLHAQQTPSDIHRATTLVSTPTTQQHRRIGSRAGGGVLEYHLDSSPHTHISHPLNTDTAFSHSSYCIAKSFRRIYRLCMIETIQIQSYTSLFLFFCHL